MHQRREEVREIYQVTYSGAQIFHQRHWSTVQCSPETQSLSLSQLDPQPPGQQADA